MTRRGLKSNWGLYKPVHNSPLLVGTGTDLTGYKDAYTNTYGDDPIVQPPPPAGAQAEWTGGPWYTAIKWDTATIAASSGRTFSQWTGALGHTYCNSDHTSDAPATTWHSHNSDPLWSFTGMFNGNVNVGGTARINIPSGFYVAIAGGDRNANVWNHDTGFHYDFYGVASINNTNHTATAQAIWQLNQSTDGWGTGVWPNGQQRGTRAAGCQFTGGAITAGDWRSVVINHGLAIACGSSNFSNSVVALPATSQDSNANVNYTGNVPFGSMLAIPPVSRGGPVKPSGLTQIGSMVWDASSTYGCYLVDSTQGWTWYADDGNDPITTSWILPLATGGGDGDKILNALRIITHGKPSLPNHA